MTTEVSICSNALLRLGADPISSFDEADTTGSNIERARLVSSLWPTIRRQVLRAHPWNVAIKRVQLSPDSTAPDFGYANRFQKPSDWLRTIAVGEHDDDRIGYRSEGNYFLCDDDVFYLVYVFDNDDPATYDASLVGALELAMAAALAYPVTNSTSLAEALSGEMRAALMLARATDAQDDPPETLGDFPLMQSRFGMRVVT